MLEPTPRFRQFESEYQRTAWRSLTYLEALARFQAMLLEARLLRPDLGLDWRADLAPDFAMARTLNGLPPA